MSASAWDLGVDKYLASPPPSITPDAVVSQLNPSQYYANQKMWGFNQALDFGQTQAAPQFALNQNTREQLASQLALTNASQSQQSGYLRDDYNTGLAQNDLQQSSLGLQRSALGRQKPLSETLHRLALEGFGLSERNSNQQSDSARRNALSSAVTRGAVSSPGLRTDFSDISNQLANQLEGYGLQRREEDTRFAETRASLADQNATLDLQAKSLNMSRDQLKTELSRGLDRLGLSTSLSIADLTAKMNSTSIEDNMLAQQIWNAALQNSDYYAQLYPGVPSNGTRSPGQSKQVKVGAQ